MKKLRLGFAVFYLAALLLSLTAFQAAAQDANFVGTWDMTVTGGGRGGSQGDGQSGGQAGGGHRGGGGAQSLTITKDGDKFKVPTKRRVATTPLTPRFQATPSPGPSSAKGATVTP